MSKFIKNIIRYLLCFFSIIFLVVFITKYTVKKNADFKLESNVTSIILGNSQPESAYNDSLISNFKNLAKSGESYFYNHQKLKHILEQNEQLNTVYIEFSTANILIREDEKIWKNRFINNQLPTYFNFLEFNDHKLLALKNSSGYTHSLFKSLKQNIKRITLNKYNYIDSVGGYLYLKRNKIQTILDTLANNNTKQHKLSTQETSLYDLGYLKKMIALCKKKDIDVYFIRSPYHKLFAGNRYEASFQKIKQNRFGDVPFLDCKNFPIENSEFGDLQHLNFIGAKKFSLWFNLHNQQQQSKIIKK
jgi:hypothetical protein